MSPFTLTFKHGAAANLLLALAEHFGKPAGFEQPHALAFAEWLNEMQSFEYDRLQELFFNMSIYTSVEAMIEELSDYGNPVENWEELREEGYTILPVQVAEGAKPQFIAFM